VSRYTDSYKVNESQRRSRTRLIPSRPEINNIKGKKGKVKVPVYRTFGKRELNKDKSGEDSRGVPSYHLLHFTLHMLLLF